MSRIAARCRASPRDDISSHICFILQFNIDKTAKTYTVIEVSDAWDGYEEYLNETAEGAYGNSQSTKNHIYVYFDKDLNGNAKEGYASIKAEVLDSFNSYRSIISGCQKYIYDRSAQTVTITNVLVGKSTGGSERVNVILKVSADKATIWLDDSENARLYSPSSNQDWVSTGTVNTLGQPKSSTVETVSYTGTGALYDGDSNLGNYAAITLVLNQDANGNLVDGTASFVVKSFGSPIISVSTTYEMTSTQITLKDAKTGNVRAGNVITSDIVFTINADGSLACSGRYNSTSSNDKSAAVDMDGVTLTKSE